MHAFAAKLGMLAMTPFLFFGGHGGQMVHAPFAHAHPTKIAVQSVLNIKNIDGPSTLGVNESGSWTVNVNVKEASSTNLHYSAVWGDEGSTTALRSMAAVETSSTMTHTYASAGTYHPKFTVSDDNGHTVSKTATVTVGDNLALHLDSITPTSGVVGSMATLTGTGFKDGDTVTVGGVAASNVSLTASDTVTFMIPQLATGTYNVRVHDGDMRSNAVSFKVTAAAPSLSISGIDAPIRLNVGEDGTWTVHAATNASSLHYSVAWGDEGSSMMRALSASEVMQTSSTFTHSYEKAGTYSPKFTVSDDSGHSQSVSAQVVVSSDNS